MTVVAVEEKYTISASAEAAKCIPRSFDGFDVVVVDQFLKVNPFLPDAVVHLAGHDDTVHIGAAYAWGVSDISMAPTIIIVGKVEDVIRIVESLTAITIVTEEMTYAAVCVTVPSVWEHSDPDGWGEADVTWAWANSVEEAMQACFAEMERGLKEDAEEEGPIYASYTETPIDAD